MDESDYTFIKALLKKRSGLILSGSKMYLVESRLSPIARDRGLESVAALIKKLQERSDENLISEITEAMTTNESFFFRDKTPFDQFENYVLPDLVRRRASVNRLRIWCAAASTGQEPYSLAMILKEKRTALSGKQVDILGTDLSSSVLAKAKAGVYSQFEVQRGLPVTKLVSNFTQSGDKWEINEDLRRMVVYRQFNLLDNFKSLGRWDVVFCRNVLIYFDPPTKGHILDKIAAQMPDDGLLFLGASESVFGLSDAFAPVDDKRGIFRVARGKVAKAQPAEKSKSTLKPMRQSSAG